MSVIIQGTGKALPEKCMKNTEIASVIDTSDDWIKSHTGITSRRVASETDTSATLASAACMSALQNACERGAVGLNADSVDLILCATATPQYSGFPSNACLIQQALGAHNAACFDLSAACSGFLYALDTAASLMERHSWRYALVCGSEVLTRIVDWKDRSTCILFGDGAGAVVLENTFVRSGLGIGAVVLGADGTGAGELYLDEENRIRMNGRAVYNFAVNVITETVNKLLEKEHLSIENIELVVCHQANERILEAAAKRLKCDPVKFVCNMENYGNTSAASIPITLDDLMKSGRIGKGMTVITAGFGAGLTWGGCVIRF